MDINDAEDDGDDSTGKKMIDNATYFRELSGR